MEDWGNGVTVGLGAHAWRVWRGLAQGASCVTSPPDRFPSAPLKQDINTFIEPMCHHSLVPCICMGLCENIQSPIWPGQANLRIMNHMWCASDTQPESSPHVSTGLLPVLEQSGGLFFFKQRKPKTPHQKEKKNVNKLAWWARTQEFIKILHRSAHLQTKVFVCKNCGKAVTKWEECWGQPQKRKWAGL